MKHLLIFTIGPVQSFIAQARKVQDLAVGSKLLSNLIAKAMNYAIVKAKAEIIFPYYEENKTEVDYPNRFIAFIETKNTQQFGKDLEDNIKDTFLTQAKELLKKSFDANKFDYAISQLNDLLKIYWVILPNVDESNYKDNYEKIERLLGGVKNLRAFEQFPEIGRKCSVNGEYNVTIYRYKSNEEEKKDKTYLKNKTPNKEGKQKRVLRWLEYTKNVTCIGAGDKVALKHLSHGEGLSTISFYKRLYNLQNGNRIKKFDATCKVAYKFAIDKLDINTQNNALRELQDLDEQYLYSDASISKQDNDKKEKIYSLQKSINSTLKKENVKLGKYYAVLVFDADHMGKWLSGKYKTEDTDLKTFQNQLSQKLGNFAQKAKDLIDFHSSIRGQTIYAGGDDYIGLIPLEYLFGVIKDLRCKFREEVSEKIENKTNEELSFSAGIAIAHYKTPLAFVLNEARAAEHSAKEEAGRNSVAITVLKRSGEIHKTYMKWFENKNFLPDNLFEIIKTLSNKENSNKFITSFTQEFLPVVGESINQDLLKSELNRLLRNNELENLNNSVFALLDHLIGKERNLKEFIGLLNIADFISRQINKITPITNVTLQKITKILKEDYSAEKIILFGSQATGTAFKDSDIDLLIIKNTETEYRKRTTEVYELLRHFSYSFDVIVLTPDEFDKRSKDKYDIAGIAKKEGRILK